MSQKQGLAIAQVLSPSVRLVHASTQYRLESRQSSRPRCAGQRPECPESIAGPHRVASACEVPKLRSYQASTPCSPQCGGSAPSSPASSRRKRLDPTLGRQQQFLQRGLSSSSESTPLFGRH